MIEREQMERDELLYGMSVKHTRADGHEERIDPADFYIPPEAIERHQIVTWLRRQHDIELARADQSPMGDRYEALTRAAQYGGTADAIERGDHIPPA